MSTDEQIAVIQTYIHFRKDVEVKIRQPQTMIEAIRLNEAYSVAADWFNKNGVTLEWV